MKKSISIVLILAAILCSCGSKDSKVPVIKLIPVAGSSGEFQYIDQEGKIVINPQFLEATIFNEGVALVKTSGDDPKWGYISEDGKFTISPQYKRATVFSEGIAWVVSENASPVAIDKKGEHKFSLQEAEKVSSYQEGLAAFSQINQEGNNMWGFVDRTGKVTINPQFSAAGNFSEGLCAVRNTEGKWGYINKDGQLVIHPQFDWAGGFSNGRAVVQSDRKYGVIGKEGRYLINPQFSQMVNDGNLYLIEQNGRYGWCDKDGKLIINPQFNEAFPFSQQKLAPVKSGNKWGYIDKSGKIIINPQFDMAFPFNGKLALVTQSNKAGFIDFDGRFKINPQFEKVSDGYVLHVVGGIKNVHTNFFGLTNYFSVETDYFNVEAILSLINLDAPMGVSLNSTFSDAINTLDITQSRFNRNRTDHQVISQKRISPDANFNLFIMGNAFETVRVQRGSGWYTYTDTEYRFAGQRKIDGLAYQFNLTGKGLGKGDLLASSIKDKVGRANYQIVERERRYTSDEVVFSNGIQDVIIFSNSSSSVTIIIVPSSDSAGNDYEEVIEVD